MNLTPSDPDIETIVSRIAKGDLDLQPSFQRGEVWSDAKKAKLIDTILREWHIPPIHIIQVKESGKLQVLDGQQRLAAIRDFVNNKIKVNGSLQPSDVRLEDLNGKVYSDLPDEVRRKFDQFTLRIFRISDYLPGEPGELFYRLNQPATLTAAEQRNAFFGPAREQVKQLVSSFGEYGLTDGFIGFNNDRMAYDDVLARLCIFLEAGSLRHKLSAGILADRYRSEFPFSDHAVGLAECALQRLGSISKLVGTAPGFNKATLFSWLWFLSQVKYDFNQRGDELAKYYLAFELARRGGVEGSIQLLLRVGSHFLISPRAAQNMLLVFNDRATARVNDTMSLLTRDKLLWVFAYSYMGHGIGSAVEMGCIESVLAVGSAEEDFPSAEKMVIELVSAVK